jgi:aerotaxis receptor
MSPLFIMGSRQATHASCAWHQMSINLQSIIGDVRSSSDRLSLATQEIAEGNMELSNWTEAQASILQQTTASHAAQAHQLASNASGVGLKSGSVVIKVMVTMQDINVVSRQNCRHHRS